MSRIENFIGERIAFYKPRKRTYYLLKWCPTKRRWFSPTLELSEHPIRKHKSSRHLASSVIINLINNTSITITSYGEYLNIGDENIPIVKRIGGHVLPVNITRREFGGVITHDDTYIRDVQLWTYHHENIIDPSATLKPLPKRIAWIIAEDACKNNETCPITMEPISPINTSVTTCFHCFQTEAIETWMTLCKTCPHCRQNCLITKAFD